MKLLLTSGGVKNPSIQSALVDLLGKPIDQCHALCIPTALYGHPMGSPQTSWRFVSGTGQAPMTQLGWQSVGVLELTALPSMDRNRWEKWVRETDALLVDGGDALYLCHWLRASGLTELFPDLEDLVWVGLSADSMVMTPRIGEEFVPTDPPFTGDDRTLGLVDFSIFPHLDHPGFAGNTMAGAEKWAATLGHHSYAIDDQSAIKVVGDAVEVVSEGNWRYFGVS
ncbi:MAG: Type 1 glutamine amidotransferase-like domain-containing protein [Trueperaceae bacterium]